MKVQELFMIDLGEAFNTRCPTNWTIDSNGNSIGTFELNNYQYRILLQRVTIHDLIIANIAFYLWDQQTNQWTTIPTMDSKYASQVIGAVVNAIHDKIASMQFDAIVFAATTLSDKRMRIYNAIANRYVKHFGNIIENVPGPDNSLFTIVCTKQVSQNFTNEEIMELIYPIMEK